MKNTIDVIGCAGTHFTGEGLEALRCAELIAGSRRLLEENQLPENAEKIILDGALLNVLPDLIAKSKIKKLVILASGDPLYCGIGATLLRFTPPERLRFFPAPTAFQQLFALLGQPWEKAGLFSLHGKKSVLPWRELLSSSLCAVYGDPGRPARTIAQELIQAFPASANRSAAVGCCLGFAKETVLRGTLAEIAASSAASESLSVLVLLPGESTAPGLPLGLPDDCYVHFKNMITHPEIRAVVLAKLRLAPGVMWDLGAGSGSVGIEAAGLCSGLQVHSVEKHAERFEHLRRNRELEGISNLTAYHCEAEEILEKLPAPNRIFIGGGGRDLLEKSFDYLAPDGILVITGVTVETIAMFGSCLTEFRKEFLMINVSRAREIADGGSMFQAENPIAVAVYAKPSGGIRR